MKKQDFRDRMHEHEGMMHGSSMGGSIYKNEVEKPSIPPFNHINARENMGAGMHDWKGEADPIAYGQAMGEGCKSDMKKIGSQFKDYHWD